MSSVPASVISDLRDKLAKAEAKIGRLQASLSSAKKDHEELVTALSVLTKHGYVETAEEQPTSRNDAGQAGLNDTYAYLLRFVPYGVDWAIAPKEVADMVRRDGREDLNGDYIRTALWRMGQRGVLQGNDGRYWRPKKEEASDASTSEASEITGPATGRGTGFPSTPPEGSIPSGSTPSLGSNIEAWDDDDVPF